MEPPYTNFTAHFVGTLDYMWYTYDRLSVGGLMEMVEDRLVQETTAPPLPPLPLPLTSTPTLPLPTSNPGPLTPTPNSEPQP